MSGPRALSSNLIAHFEKTLHDSMLAGNYEPALALWRTHPLSVYYSGQPILVDGIPSVTEPHRLKLVVDLIFKNASARGSTELATLMLMNFIRDGMGDREFAKQLLSCVNDGDAFYRSFAAPIVNIIEQFDRREAEAAASAVVNAAHQLKLYAQHLTYFLKRPNELDANNQFKLNAVQYALLAPFLDQPNFNMGIMKSTGDDKNGYTIQVDPKAFEAWWDQYGAKAQLEERSQEFDTNLFYKLPYHLDELKSYKEPQEEGKPKSATRKLFTTQLTDLEMKGIGPFLAELGIVKIKFDQLHMNAPYQVIADKEKYRAFWQEKCPPFILEQRDSFLGRHTLFTKKPEDDATSKTVETPRAPTSPGNKK